MNKVYKILFGAIVAVALAQPAFAQNGAASQIGNNAFDSLNRALRVNAVATGGGGNSSASFLNLDQLLSSVYDSTHGALNVNIVSGLPCTANASGAITCTATGTNQNITLTPSGTGASVATNLQDKGGQVFSVKAYGAKGDGTTDDTAAINAAKNAAAAVAGTVFFPCGTYLTTSAIAVSSATTWQGASRDCVTIGPAAAAAFDVFDVTSNNVSFKDLTVNANGSGSTDNGILLTGAPLDHITLDHVTVENAGNWCVSWGNGAASAVSDLLVTNSTFTGCGGPALGGITNGTVSASNMRFSNNIIGDDVYPRTLLTTQAHASLYISNNGTGTLSNIVIDNNIVPFPILGNGGVQQESDGIVVSTGGISGSSISGVTVSSNLIFGTPGNTPTDSHGMEFWGSDQDTISSNIILNAYTGVLAQNGAGASVHGTLSGNYISIPLSANTGIQINPNAYFEVNGNHADSGGDFIQVASGNTTVTGNDFTGSGTVGQVVSLKCQQSSACLNDTVSSNNLSSGTQNGINIESGTSAFSGLSITDNRINVSNSDWAIYTSATGNTGTVSGNTILTTTNLYTLTSGLALNAVTAVAPSGTCNNGSKWTNTAGGSGTTFYGCEAAAWVAK